MATPALSTARKLLAAIDELVLYHAKWFPTDSLLSSQLTLAEFERFNDLEGNVLGLRAKAADGEIPLSGHRPKPVSKYSFTRATGIKYRINSRDGSRRLYRYRPWSTDMAVLRAAVNAVVEVEESGRQTDKKPDTTQKRKERAIKNRLLLLRLDKAIKKGWKRGFTMEESARELVEQLEPGLTEEEVRKRGQALLKSLHRNRDRLKRSKSSPRKTDR